MKRFHQRSELVPKPISSSVLMWKISDIIHSKSNINDKIRRRPTTVTKNIGSYGLVKNRKTRKQRQIRRKN